KTKRMRTRTKNCRSSENPTNSAAHSRLRQVEFATFSARLGRLGLLRQLNADKPNMHHDALEFPNGEIVLVTRLCEDQYATVLQLPASPHSVKDEVELKHAAVVG